VEHFAALNQEMASNQGEQLLARKYQTSNWNFLEPCSFWEGIFIFRTELNFFSTRALVFFKPAQNSTV
jgi:hypothetical protein